MRIFKNKKHQGNKGFTIVEVLIATTVFSLVLAMTVTVILDFTHNYYKAVNTSTTENAAQSVLNDVTQAIKFSSSPVTDVTDDNGDIRTYCIGNVQFDYEPYTFGSDDLWESPTGPAGCSYQSPSSSSQELLASNNLQVLKFIITPIPNPGSTYTVEVEVGYGSNSNNLICDTSQPNNSTCPQTGNGTGTGSQDSNTDSFSCVISQGSQFCDVVDLTGTVQRLLPS